jgi:hypothetical protein
VWDGKPGVRREIDTGFLIRRKRTPQRVSEENVCVKRTGWGRREPEIVHGKGNVLPPSEVVSIEEGELPHELHPSQPRCVGRVRQQRCPVRSCKDRG